MISLTASSFYRPPLARISSVPALMPYVSIIFSETRDGIRGMVLRVWSRETAAGSLYAAEGDLR
ncbi:hypothetical protein [Streptomyces sp. NPDC060035]|uniref:hypothetical protein n=1 Tax=Streptomyces sp. NPDC060035 TaxID=3347044 RepID=UPI0036792A0A